MKRWTLEFLYECDNCEWQFVDTEVNSIKFCPGCGTKDPLFISIKNKYKEIIESYSAIDEPTEDDAISLHEELVELLDIQDLTLSEKQQRICFRIAEYHSISEARFIAFELHLEGQVDAIDISELIQDCHL